MESDQTFIESAYAEALRGLYAKLFESYLEAGADTAQHREADERFKIGVRFARSSRDRALVLLSEA
ncbi:MAG TPA: hypothetical protein VG273_07145 [Bryobacteraceae bacterium]|jgi:hypothetical protein|nr:hypothetical protein [Bryobacteraceae bacterium]